MDRFEKINREIQYYLQDVTEMNCNFKNTANVAENIAEIVNKYIPCSFSDYDKIKISELSLRGFSYLEKLNLDKNKVQEITNHFKNIPVFAGHVPAHSDGIRRYLDGNANKHSFGSYEFEDSIQCPHILELALSSEVLSLVEAYLGCAPTIYSINTWWSFPGFPAGVAQDFHRDVDDFKFLSLFIFLTDVVGGSEGGQHRFITHTHQADNVEEILRGDKELTESLFLPKLKENGYNNSALYELSFRDQITDITGKAGSVFIADTFALHKGVPPISDPRLVCWVRYGIRQNLAHADNARVPMPFSKIQHRIQPSLKNKYIMRLFTADDEANSPEYKVETDSGIQNIVLEDYDWKIANKKHNLNSGKFVSNIMKKITRLLREPSPV